MKKILIGIDFSDADGTLLEAITPLAQQLKASVTLFHSEPPMSQWVGCYMVFVSEDIAERKKVASELKAKLQTIADGLTAQGIQTDVDLIESHAGPGIVKYAEENDFDLIVICTHSKDLLERALLGSTADHVVRKSSLPILVVPTMSE